jgi:hypothetical protein
MYGSNRIKWAARRDRRYTDIYVYVCTTLVPRNVRPAALVPHAQDPQPRAHARAVVIPRVEHAAPVALPQPGKLGRVGHLEMPVCNHHGVELLHPFLHLLLRPLPPPLPPRSGVRNAPPRLLQLGLGLVLVPFLLPPRRVIPVEEPRPSSGSLCIRWEDGADGPDLRVEGDKARQPVCLGVGLQVRLHLRVAEEGLCGVFVVGLRLAPGSVG